MRRNESCIDASSFIKSSFLNMCGWFCAIVWAWMYVYLCYGGLTGSRGSSWRHLGSSALNNLNPAWEHVQDISTICSHKKVWRVKEHLTPLKVQWTDSSSAIFHSILRKSGVLGCHNSTAAVYQKKYALNTNWPDTEEK